jgi:hypothetical protein
MDREPAKRLGSGRYDINGLASRVAAGWRRSRADGHAFPTPVNVAANGGGTVADIRRWLNALLLAGAGAILGATDTRFPLIVGLPHTRTDLISLVIGAVALVVALLAANTFWRLPWRQPAIAIALAFLGCLVAGWLGGVSWPNSGDEYAYTYQADTFAAGRLWNKAPADPSLFEQFQLVVKDGRMLSSYPPGWAAILLPFSLFGITWLTNPLATVALGVALDGGCRQLGLSNAVRKSILALILLTPFTLFLGGSLFPQTLAGALVASVVWAQLADEACPRRWRKLLIGALFGMILATRPDVFVVVVPIYAIDRLWARRLSAIFDGVWVAVGFLPFAVSLGAYNAGITGDPLLLPSTWGTGSLLGSIKDGVGETELARSFSRNLYFLGRLAQYGGLPVAALGLLALEFKLRWRRLRFYDLLFPAAVLFYAFIPFTGGHQYGPRYWFWAWPFAALTAATAIVDSSCQLRLWGRTVLIDRFAAASLAFAIGAFCVLLITTHVYIEARHQVYAFSRPDMPAIVLLPTRGLLLWPWQVHKVYMSSPDFTRNDLDLKGPILYGRLDVPDAVARACKLTGREVYRWELPGRLIREVCP